MLKHLGMVGTLGLILAGAAWASPPGFPYDPTINCTTPPCDAPPTPERCIYSPPSMNCTPESTTEVPTVLGNLRKLAQARALIRKGEVCEKAGDLENACEYYEQATLLCPGSSCQQLAQSRLTYARDLLASRLYEKAVQSAKASAEAAGEETASVPSEETKNNLQSKIKTKRHLTMVTVKAKMHAAIEAGDYQQAIRLAKLSLMMRLDDIAKRFSHIRHMHKKGDCKKTDGKKVEHKLPCVDPKTVEFMEEVEKKFQEKNCCCPKSACGKSCCGDKCKCEKSCVCGVSEGKCCSSESCWSQQLHDMLDKTIGIEIEVTDFGPRLRISTTLLSSGMKIEHLTNDGWNVLFTWPKSK